MNALFASFKQALLQGEINMIKDRIVVALIDTAEYVADLKDHRWLSDIPSTARVATSPALTNKKARDGVFEAGPVTFKGVYGNPCHALVIYRAGPAPWSSHLIAYLDSVVGLPVVPNGADIELDWDDGPNKIFNLTN